MIANAARRVSISVSQVTAKISGNVTKAHMANLASQYSLTMEQIQNYYEAFRLFDKDDDGKVTFKELGVVIQSLGAPVKDEDLKDVVSDLDVDGNGTIEFEEFVEIMATRAKTVSDESDLYDIFTIFDKDKDGLISGLQLRFVLKNLGESMEEEEISEMIREVDADGDGLITFQEFLKMMTST